MWSLLNCYALSWMNKEISQNIIEQLPNDEQVKFYEKNSIGNLLRTLIFVWFPIILIFADYTSEGTWQFYSAIFARYSFVFVYLCFLVSALRKIEYRILITDKSLYVFGKRTAFSLNNVTLKYSIRLTALKSIYIDSKKEIIKIKPYRGSKYSTPFNSKMIGFEYIGARLLKLFKTENLNIQVENALYSKKKRRR